MFPDEFLLDLSDREATPDQALLSQRLPSLYSVSLSPPGFPLSSLVFVLTLFYILHVCLGSFILTYSDDVTHH